MINNQELQFMLRNLGIELSDELIDGLMKEASKTGEICICHFDELFHFLQINFMISKKAASVKKWSFWSENYFNKKIVVRMISTESIMGVDRIIKFQFKKIIIAKLRFSFGDNQKAFTASYGFDIIQLFK